MHRGDGMSRLIAALMLIAALSPVPAAAQSSCRFVLGFAELWTALGPEVAGDCLEDQRALATRTQYTFPNGLVLTYPAGTIVQTTTRGLMTWSPTENATDFTDGVNFYSMTRRGVLSMT